MKRDTDNVLYDLPLQCVIDFLGPVEALCFAETCSSRRAAVMGVDGGKVPPIEPTYLEELVIDDRLEMVKWLRTQRLPCPCDFVNFRGLAKKDGAVRAYFQI